MKRTGILLLGLALTAAGCVELPIRMDPKPPTAPESTPAAIELPPVTAEQVNEENAPKVLTALRDELDRSTNERPVVEPPPPPPKTGPRYRGN